MDQNLNNLIDTALVELSQNGHYMFYEYLTIGLKKPEDKVLTGFSKEVLVNEMVELNLIRRYKDLIITSQHGQQVISVGGWQAYVDQKEKAVILERKKLNVDFKLNKWLLKTKFLPLFFSLVGLGLSIVALMKGSVGDDKIPVENESLIEVTDSVVIKQKEETLNLYPKDSIKQVDSLKGSKSVDYQ